MSGEEPAWLPVGTEVSAKYRGAFCEAKVKKVIRLVKCKVTVKDTNVHLVVTDDDIQGTLKVGVPVEVRLPDTGTYAAAVVNKINDQSTYTVVFDDGDENTLRRTQLCLKGEKHFVKSETLDQLPLTHPEHFGTPVMKPGKRTRKTTYTGSDSESEDNSSDVSEEPTTPRREVKGRWMLDMIGQVVCIEVEDRKKTVWVPALVSHPSAADTPLLTKDHMLAKSFKDGKFYSVTRREIKEFSREMAISNEDKSLKTAFDKALTYFDNSELPSAWRSRKELLGEESDDDEESLSSDDEPSEEKDLFVAQLFKFMDDRGTPINKAPSIHGRDLTLYRLFKVVQNLGGYNKVTNLNKWRQVYSKMSLPASNAASSLIKQAYKKYLHAFEDFYRKLGSSMGTISRPGRNRHGSGRSLLSFREREAPRSPKSPKKDDSKAKDLKAAEKAKEVDKHLKQEDEDLHVGAGDSPRKSRSRAAAEDRKREDSKDSGVKAGEGGAKTADTPMDANRPVMRLDLNRLKDDIKMASTRSSREREEGKKKEEAATRAAQRDREDSKKKEEPTKTAKEASKKATSKDDAKTKEEAKKKEEAKGKEETKKKDEGKCKEETKKKDEGKAKEETKKKDEGKAKEETKKKDEGKAKEETKKKDEGKAKEETKKKDEGKAKEDSKKKDEKSKEDAKKKDEAKSVSKKKEEGKTNEGKKVESVKKSKEEERERRIKLAGVTEKGKPGKGGDAEGKKEKVEDEAAQQKRASVRGKKSPRGREEEEMEMEILIKEGEETDSSEQEEEIERKATRRSEPEHTVGSRLKVKYGRGRNQKIYEAKIIESQSEGYAMHYLVHYAGWNNRYDEWIMKDRIDSVLEAADPTKVVKVKPSLTAVKSKLLLHKSKLKPAGMPGAAKVLPSGGCSGTPLDSSSSTIGGSCGGAATPPLSAHPASLPSTVPSRSGPPCTPTTTSATSMPAVAVCQTAPPAGPVVMRTTAAVTVVTPTSRPMSSRLTRQSSLEAVPSPPRRRTRHNSGVGDDAADLQSHGSTESENESSADEQEAEAVPVDVPTAASRPSVASRLATAKLQSEPKTPAAKQTTPKPHTEAKTPVKPKDNPVPVSPAVKSEVKAEIKLEPTTGVAEKTEVKVVQSEVKVEPSDMKVEKVMSEMKAVMVREERKTRDIIASVHESVSYIDALIAREIKGDTDLEQAEAASSSKVTSPSKVMPLSKVLTAAATSPSKDILLTPSKDRELVKKDIVKEKESKLSPGSDDDVKAKVKRKDVSKAAASMDMSRDVIPAAVGSGPAPAEPAVTVEAASPEKQDDTKEPKPKKMKVEKKIEKKTKAVAIEKVVRKGKDVVEEKLETAVDREKIEVEKKKTKKKVKKKSTAEQVEETIARVVMAGLAETTAREQAESSSRLQQQQHQNEATHKLPGQSPSQPLASLPLQVTSVKSPFESSPHKLHPYALALSAAMPSRSVGAPAVSALVEHSKADTVPSQSVPLAAGDLSAAVAVPVLPGPAAVMQQQQHALSSVQLASQQQPPPTLPASVCIPVASCSSSATAAVASLTASISAAAAATSSISSYMSSAPRSSSSITATLPLPSAPALASTTTSVSSISMMDNTPPDTPEHSPPDMSPHSGGSSPRSSSADAGLYGDALSAEGRGGLSLVGGESPGTCDISTISNSSSGSSGNLPSSESSSGGEGTTNAATSVSAAATKRKHSDMTGHCSQESNTPTTTPKKRKRGHKRSITGDNVKSSLRHHSTLPNSDSDEAASAEATIANVMASMSNFLPNPLMELASAASPTKHGCGANSSEVSTPTATHGSMHHRVRPPRTLPKFNFSLDEGKFLEGEPRINFLVDKIQEIRKIYMSLKAEVTCIDRRRKRAKRKEKEAAAQAHAMVQFNSEFS